MKFKSKIVLMASIILMISSFAQVFALNIDIYPTKDPENNICYMEYENPHPNTIRSYFEKQKEKTLDSAGFVSDGACLCNIESDDFPTGGYYNGIKYMITVEPTSNYVGTKEDKNNYYEYVTYRTDQVYVDNDDGWKLNRTKHKGLRPVTKSKYNISVTDTKIAQSTDDYMIVNRCCKNGIGQYSWKVLCQTRSDATYRCNGHHSGDKVISNGHIYVSKNVITSEILQKIRQHPVYKSKEYKKNNYLYISEVKRMSESFVISRKNSTLYTSGQLVKAIVNPSGTIPQWGSSNIRDPESSLINTYDNKLHIAHLITKGLTVRYYDISGKENARIETDRVEDPNVKITKSNGTKFTPEDITNMKYKEEVVEMDQNSDDGYKIKVPDDAILIGYNVTINKQKDYANKVKIEIEHKNQVNYPGNSQGGDVYLDVFVNSKKRVYVRNKDLPEKYCDIDNSTIKNITPKIVKGLKNIEKSPIESEMVNQNDLLVDTSFKGEKQGEYTEVYWVPVKNYLLLKLIGEDDEDSDTSFAGFYIGQDPVAKKAKASLESWYTGEDPIKQQYDVAVNIATSKKDETTYVDMFYLDYKIDVIPSQIIEMSSEVDLTGGLYFQSDEEAFKQKTKNERLGHLVDDVIPSGETLYAGVLEVYPYILQSVNLLKEERIERITNGRQTTKFKVVDYTLKDLSLYTIKDNVKIFDDGLSEARLFDGEIIKYPRLSDAYLSTKNGTVYEKGSIDIDYREDGSNKYFSITVDGDKLTHNGVEIIPDTYNEVVKDQLIEVHRDKSYRVKNPETNKLEVKTTEDITKRKYYKPSIPRVVQADDYEARVRAALSSRNAPEKIDRNGMHELYKDNNYLIPPTSYNGKRELKAEIEYEPTFKIGNASANIIKLKQITPNYDVEPVIIHTPVIADMKLQSDESNVNHTNVSSDATGDIIQKNAPFTVEMIVEGGGKHTKFPMVTNFLKYTKEHHIKFLFDLQYAKIYDSNGNEVPEMNIDTIIPSGTWIKVAPGGKIVTQAVYVPDETENDIVTALISKYQMKTIANNAPSSNSFLEAVLNQDGNSIGGYSEEQANKTEGLVPSIHEPFHPGCSFENEARYAARDQRKTKNIGRIYDFKISDLVDIDWKYVFRKQNGIDHSGKVYFAGNKKWNMYSSESNELIEREGSEIGTNPQRVLPIGPYKHSNSGYYSAPKLGYTFSFDVKTTGGIDISNVGEGVDKVDKKVEIVPTYYFVGKDGTRYEKDIDLYYKNNVGKYIKLGSSADPMSITMRPEDGSRYISQYEPIFNERYLSKDMISIGKYNEKLTLKADTNMATNNKRFVQLWYGSYKLPNSTIAVKKNEKDLKNALTDGYIGVKFEITCIEEMSGGTEYKIGYAVEDLSRPDEQNTTQWDYEAYLGCTPGQAFNGSLRLEKGDWQINNDLYQDIKGTVLLYDADARAADDFDTGAVT